jgi:hypothetical protein
MGFRVQIADAETRRQVATRHYKSGFLRYLLVRGILKFALPLFVLFSLYSYFVIGNHGTAATIARYTATICVVMGCLVAVANWLVILRAVRGHR